MSPRILLLAASAFALAACGGEEESVAERFNRISGEVDNKGAAYEAQAENMVSQEERLRDAEAEAMARQTQNEIGELSEADNALLGSGSGSGNGANGAGGNGQ